MLSLNRSIGPLCLAPQSLSHLLSPDAREVYIQLQGNADTDSLLSPAAAVVVLVVVLVAVGREEGRGPQRAVGVEGCSDAATDNNRVTGRYKRIRLCYPLGR